MLELINRARANPAAEVQRIVAAGHMVTATGGNIGAPATQTVTIGTQNVEADFIATNATPSAPAILTQPQNMTPAAGAASFSFSVSASGYPTPTVQWQVAPYQSTTFTNIPGATGFVYTAPVAANLNGNQYQAVVTNSPNWTGPCTN